MRVLTGSALIITIFSTPMPVLGHPGGLDAQGCHNSRKTDDYHCGDPSGRSSKHVFSARALSGSTHFGSCAEARAAGAAPVRRGDPGFAPKLDRDGDGVGCE